MVRPLYTDAELQRLAPPGAANLMQVEDRPVFTVHEMRGGRGKIGKRELEKIRNRSNNRLNTGDWCPMIINHTKDDGTIDPEIIGFAGPFFDGEIGDKQKKPAIFAKQWVFKDKQDKYRDHPRVSVEFWQDKEDPGCGFFDPIACLGATTPELDLGVHYERNGILIRYQKAEQYEAAFPGGSGPNTSIPGGPGDDDEDDIEEEEEDDEEEMKKEKEPKSYEREEGGTLSEADIQQIVQALIPTIDAKITEKTNALNKAVAAVTMAQEADDDTDDGELEPEAPAGMEPAAPPPPGQPPLPGAGPADADPSKPPAKAPPFGKPAAADKSPGDDKKKPPKRFSRSAPGEPDMADQNPEVARYQKERDEFKSQRDELSVKYSKQTEELTAAQAKLAEVETEKRKAVRYNRLKEKLDLGYQFDLTKEAEYTGSFSDEQFDAHVTHSIERYQRVPLGQLPGIEKPILRTGVPDQEKAQKYAKVAEKVCLDLKIPGERYGEVLENVTKNNGRYIAA